MRPFRFLATAGGYPGFAELTSLARKAEASSDRTTPRALPSPMRSPWSCQCGTGFLADPGFRRRVTEATGVPEATLEAAAVADPHATVKADVERLLTSPLLASKVSVSGHVYDIATGHLATTVDARYP